MIRKQPTRKVNWEYRVGSAPMPVSGPYVESTDITRFLNAEEGWDGWEFYCTVPKHFAPEQSHYIYRRPFKPNPKEKV